MASQKKKVTLYFNAAMLAETQKEALRQDRSISWIIQAAWKLAREEVKRMPTALNATTSTNGAAAAAAAPVVGEAARAATRGV
jgi:uncharacterized small protein (TIGR04563 family)